MMADVFSVDICVDAAGRFYFYQRVNDQWRFSKTYPTIDDLQRALTADAVEWMEWRST